MTPHVYPFALQLVVGVQPPATHAWFVQTSFVPGHPGHASIPPQPSGPAPHDHPSCPHVEATHWHWNAGVQTSFGLGHVPQLSIPPHPSDGAPHTALSCGHVFGVHVPTPQW
jgi:hypothetical protein